MVGTFQPLCSEMEEDAFNFLPHQERDDDQDQEPDDDQDQERDGDQGQEDSVDEMQTPFPEDVSKSARRCGECGKMFANYKLMRNHFKSVHKRDVICDICAKGFPTRTALNIHRMGHTGEKNFPCHICGQSYKTKHYLIIHTRLHTGEKPHCCEQCGKAFADPSALKNHQKQHQDTPGVACEICGKIFKMQKNLKRHMIVHSNGNLSDTGPRIYSNDFKLDVLKKVQEFGISATAKLVKYCTHFLLVHLIIDLKGQDPVQHDQQLGESCQRGTQLSFLWKDISMEGST